VTAPYNSGRWQYAEGFVRPVDIDPAHLRAFDVALAHLTLLGTNGWTVESILDIAEVVSLYLVAIHPVAVIVVYTTHSNLNDGLFRTINE
jgi:hypothetical protein